MTHVDGYDRTGPDGQPVHVRDYQRHGTPPVISYSSGATAPAQLRGYIVAGTPIGVSLSEMAPGSASWDMVVGYAQRGGRIFVDSGAFPAFMQGIRQGGQGGTVDWAEWRKKVATLIYNTLGGEGHERTTIEGPRLHIVMPDVIGQQAESLQLLAENREFVRAVIDARQDALVAIQKGELGPYDCWREAARILGTDDFTACVPSNKVAFSEEDLGSLMGGAVKPSRVHFLGVAGNLRKLASLAAIVHRANPSCIVTSDANRLRAKVGQGRPLTEGKAKWDRRLKEMFRELAVEGGHHEWVEGLNDGTADGAIEPAATTTAIVEDEARGRQQQDLFGGVPLRKNLALDEIPDCHCESTFEHLFKALAENPAGDERAMWAPHENPYLTAHVEDVTRRLSAILERIMDALSIILRGEPIGRLGKSDAPWLRWHPEVFDSIRIMLESKPSSSYTLEDWLLVADYIIQRYLPPGVISTEAEYLTVRAALMGKIQAAQTSPMPPPPDIMAAWASLTPTYFATVPARLLTNQETSVLRITKERAALHISNLTEKMRSKMKDVILEHVQAQILGQKEGTNKILATRLFDEFGLLNRDFRRIAITEAGEACLTGFIAARPFGSKVIRREAYRGACAFCRSIDGLTFEVVDPNAPEKDGKTQVWVGKTNAGRSASPRMREGDRLVERGPEKLWWVAAGVQHPNCRGVWLQAPDAPKGADPAFLDWMEGMIAARRGQSPAS